jgi:hypothetical protein
MLRPSMLLNKRVPSDRLRIAGSAQLANRQSRTPRRRELNQAKHMAAPGSSNSVTDIHQSAIATGLELCDPSDGNRDARMNFSKAGRDLNRLAYGAGARSQ